MHCPVQNRENANVLLDYCARRLDPETSAVLERHIAMCPQCREFAVQQQAVWAALDSWEGAPVSMDFDRRLYGCIERRENAVWWRHVFQPFERLSFRPALSLAAACMTVVAVALLQEPSAINAPPQARADAVEIEQVERTLDDLDMVRQLDALGVSVKEAAPRSL